MRKPLNSLLIKPAGPDCNLDCKYCFYLDRAQLFEAGQHRMNDKVLSALIQQSLEQSTGQMNYAWQGGEPTLMGLDFYKTVVELQRRHGRGKLVANAIQTNGILLDREWVEFFRKHGWLVGISLDGPAHIHNRYRKNVGGGDSHELTERGARLLLANHVAVNALSVVNAYSIRYPEAIYEYLKRLGFVYMQFIPCVEVDKESGQVTDYSISAEAYGEFLIRLFEVWREDFQNDQPSTSIRYFDSVLNTYMGHHPGDCTLLAECGEYLVVEHDGSVYSCDFYVNEEHLLGRLPDDELAPMLNGPIQQDFGARKARLPGECLECQWRQHCQGGCPKDRHDQGSGARLNVLCEGWKQFFAHTDGFWQELAR